MRKVKNVLMIIVLFLVTLIVPAIVTAEVGVNGYFIANDNCEALKSIKNKSNPGDIHLMTDMAYKALAKNKEDATHYRVKVKYAFPQERWVPVGCGMLLTNCREFTVNNSFSNNPVADTTTSSANGNDYLLALSWQPSFCQNNQDKTECLAQSDNSYDATHFSLHGLWPQPERNTYCNVTNENKELDEQGKWDQLPVLGLSIETYDNLMKIMPGVISYLQRHEWIKHGTCYSTSPEEYFKESIMLTNEINVSVVSNFFKNNIGFQVTSDDIRAKFDEAFGNGAGNRVEVKCDDGMISELRINLSGKIDDNSKLKELILSADSVSPGCKRGLIDAAGF